MTLIKSISGIKRRPAIGGRAGEGLTPIDIVKFTAAFGEFINDAEGKEVLSLGESLDFDFAEVEQLGKVEKNDSYLQKHIADVLALDLVDAEAVPVTENAADLGIAVDPDVDRLVFMMEDGELFGEEYTLVAVADYILQHTKGNTVSNLSSNTVPLRCDCQTMVVNIFGTHPLGEVNVVTKMKEVNAVNRGGEGMAESFIPASHYGS
ncbi:hypothetical protein FQR65_LT15924 [Abscondita terminalis]|nr:hypothetical protein FQR65_LT15924 [Abscondita terminalis]